MLTNYHIYEFKVIKKATMKVLILIRAPACC